ncbi:hypothetical protein [Sporosarcina sp. FA9]|uniref:hypothetical protein n=1 Tax=Sporosarcina sp. FA9 TaxID=3413030 RepID=UPI003F6569A6
MKKKKTNRQLKLEEMHKQFNGMTDYEIEHFIPKIPVTLFKRKSDGNVGSCIASCPICGRKHLHHWKVGNNEYRVAHCERVKYLVYPMQYELFLDWNYSNNAKYKDQYLQQIIDYERDPEEFQKAARKKQRYYHNELEAKRERKLDQRLSGHW